jgi:hypothetical protein
MSVEPFVRFPVVCPKCASERLMEFPVEVLASALLKDTPIRFKVMCHSLTWDAQARERDQIREYLASVTLDFRRRRTEPVEEISA